MIINRLLITGAGGVLRKIALEIADYVRKVADRSPTLTI